jgi:ribosome maturation factor RimP
LVQGPEREEGREAHVPGESDIQALADAVEALAAPVVEAHGLTLVDVDVRGTPRRMAVRFFVDKPGGVSIADCQAFSAEIGDVLDVANVVPGSYDLEVSSPGLDRELRKDRELRWAVGRRVHVWTREPVDGAREFVGQLVEVGEDFLSLEETGNPRRVPRALLGKVRLWLEGRIFA